MSLIDLKQSPSEAKENSMCAPCGNGEMYPYGLSITLNNEVLAKLGFKGPVTAGSQVSFSARAEIASTSQHKDADGSVDNSMSLQITAMQIDDTGFATMYPNSNMK